MSTERARIREKARRNRDEVFTSLYHHITDVDNLRACFHELDGKKAVGVDEVSKEEYGKELESNLLDLSDRLKRGGYRPPPSLRVYIPKEGSEKGRPLGISTFECKIVEMSIKRTLEGIYEETFEESSYGFREGHNPHQCLNDFGRTIQQKRISYVVEADIRKFFDRVNHEWLMKFSGASDPRSPSVEARQTIAERRHHGGRTVQGNGRRDAAGLHSVAPALKYLPALRAGYMVPYSIQEDLPGGSILLPLCG